MREMNGSQNSFVVAHQSLLIYFVPSVGWAGKGNDSCHLLYLSCSCLTNECIFWRPAVWMGIGNVFGEMQAFNLRNNHPKVYRDLWEGKESAGLVCSLQERGAQPTGSSLARCYAYSVLWRRFNTAFLRLYNWRIKKFENLIDGEGEREVFWMVCRLLPPQVFITPFLQGIMGHRSGVLIHSSCIPHFACFLSHLPNQGPSPPLCFLQACLCVCMCERMCVHIWVCVCLFWACLLVSSCLLASSFSQGKTGYLFGGHKGESCGKKKNALYMAKIRTKITALWT